MTVKKKPTVEDGAPANDGVSTEHGFSSYKENPDHPGHVIQFLGTPVEAKD